MYRKDLNAIYTDCIKHYFNLGYLIDTEYGCGHQGEIVKTVLLNPTRNIRICIWLENKFKYKDKYIDSIVLKIGYQPKENAFWLSELKMIYEKNYFNVSHKYKKWYIDNYKEVLISEKKYIDRQYNSTKYNSTIGEINYRYNSNKFINYAWNWFKNKKPKGMSKYNKKDILYIEKYKPPLSDMIYLCNRPYFFLYFKDGNYIEMTK